MKENKEIKRKYNGGGESGGEGWKENKEGRAVRRLGSSPLPEGKLPRGLEGRERWARGRKERREREEGSGQGDESNGEHVLGEERLVFPVSTLRGEGGSFLSPVPPLPPHPSFLSMREKVGIDQSPSPSPSPFFSPNRRDLSARVTPRRYRWDNIRKQRQELPFSSLLRHRESSVSLLVVSL